MFIAYCFPIRLLLWFWMLYINSWMLCLTILATMWQNIGVGHVHFIFSARWIDACRLIPCQHLCISPYTKGAVPDSLILDWESYDILEMIRQTGRSDQVQLRPSKGHAVNRDYIVSLHMTKELVLLLSGWDKEAFSSSPSIWFHSTVILWRRVLETCWYRRFAVKNPMRRPSWLDITHPSRLLYHKRWRVSAL